MRPRDAHHLADTLKALLADPARLTAYGAAGRRIAADEFSEAKVIAETLALYARLLPEPGPAEI